MFSVSKLKAKNGRVFFQFDGNAIILSLLNLTPTAYQAIITSEYRKTFKRSCLKLQKVWHPDKDGPKEVSQAINQVIGVLSSSGGLSSYLNKAWTQIKSLHYELLKLENNTLLRLQQLEGIHASLQDVREKTKALNSVVDANKQQEWQQSLVSMEAELNRLKQGFQAVSSLLKSGGFTRSIDPDLVDIKSLTELKAAQSSCHLLDDFAKLYFAYQVLTREIRADAASQLEQRIVQLKITVETETPKGTDQQQSAALGPTLSTRSILMREKPALVTMVKKVVSTLWGEESTVKFPSRKKFADLLTNQIIRTSVDDSWPILRYKDEFADHLRAIVAEHFPGMAKRHDQLDSYLNNRMYSRKMLFCRHIMDKVLDVYCRRMRNCTTTPQGGGGGKDGPSAPGP